MERLSFEQLIELEQKRQDDNVELIASENFCNERVRNVCGSILTNKYAEGYPGKRYYGGCKYIDMIERKAIENACMLFSCNYANVQPHSGSSANMAVYKALIDNEQREYKTVLGMDLGAGGHLTHGHKLSFSGAEYNVVSYGIDANGILDYNDIENKLYEYKPRILLIGASSYSRIIDYKRIKDILDKYNEAIEIELKKSYSGESFDIAYEADKCYYFVDMAHVAGLVAAGLHPNPCEYADVVTSTTHKTLRGPRGGLILWNDSKLTKKINSAVFPYCQGGPLEHIIAAKGICFEEASTLLFKLYAQQVIDNAKVFATEMQNKGWIVVSGGTDNHMFVLDTYNSIGLTGKEVEEALDKINITLNKNQIPNDTLPPLKSSGVRIGTPAMTTKCWKEEDFKDLSYIIDGYLRRVKDGDLNEEQVLAYKEMIFNLVHRRRD